MNTTAKRLLASLLVLTGASALRAAAVIQTTVTTVTTTPPAAVLVVQDGSTEKNYMVLDTRHGVTSVMEDDMRLRNGIVIHRDGTLIVPGKSHKQLRPGDWLTFGGTLTRADGGKVEQLRPSD